MIGAMRAAGGRHHRALVPVEQPRERVERLDVGEPRLELLEGVGHAGRLARREQGSAPSRCQPADPAQRVANGTRTRDHRDHNPGLYQLSYRHREAGLQGSPPRPRGTGETAGHGDTLQPTRP